MSSVNKRLKSSHDYAAVGGSQLVASGHGSSPSHSGAASAAAATSTAVPSTEGCSGAGSNSGLTTSSLIPLNPVKQSDLVNYDEAMSRLLTQLLEDTKQAKIEKDHSDQALMNILKTHDKIQAEQKNKKQTTQYLKSKLKGLYKSASTNTEREAASYRKALARIAHIKVLRSEKLLTGSGGSAGGDKSSKPSKPAIRRGVLMSVLSQYSLTVPIFCGKPGEMPPPLCGATPSASDYICGVKDKVAARVKGVEEPDENWILAEVVAYDRAAAKYHIDDIDADDECQRSHVISKRRIIPLPKCRANPALNPEALFAKNSLVLALYPQTTCFYKAVIHISPATHVDDYSVLFEDNTYPEGYSPPLGVAQCYVVACKETKSKRS